jgi:hypothetical protein
MQRFIQSKLAVPATRAWRRAYFFRHLIEMYLAMQLGMALGPLAFAVALGASVGETRQQHPVAFLFVMAFSMTVPMVAWMLRCGHSWRSAGEMAVVMIAPALPLIGLTAGEVVSGSACAYMTASTIAMIALIVYRRGEYRATAGAHVSAAASGKAQRSALRTEVDRA